MNNQSHVFSGNSQQLAYVTNELVTILQASQLSQQERADVCSVSKQALVANDVQHRQSDKAAHGIAAERAATSRERGKKKGGVSEMPQSTNTKLAVTVLEILHAIRKRCCDLRCRDHGADRMAVSDRLSERHLCRAEEHDGKKQNNKQ